MGEAVYFSWNLFWYLIRSRYDVIDCTQSPHLHYYTAKLVSIIKRSPVIITWHEAWRTNDYWKSYIGLLGLIGTIVDITSIRLASQIIASSTKTKDDLVSISVKPEIVSVIPNGIEYCRIVNAVEPFEDAFDVVYVGRMIRGKNVDVLVNAISILAKKYPKIKLALIGDGPESVSLKNLVNDLGIGANVRFFGFVQDHDDVISIIKASKILVHPSTQEGGPSIVTLEANACGLPVIVVNHKMGVSRELVIEGYNGFLVKSLSPELFAERISLLLDDVELRKEMSSNSRKFAEDFDWKQIIILLEKVYKNVLIR